ncbi:MAG TPA: GNAT family N-acetyltransferase [Gemmatimonadaceae bacterium]|jgi:aminoglycoside 6'-N-acetyltransferase I|nr:GNAT family N-acetyltransferase [Gemmatimonadaceae bacterium]
MRTEIRLLESHEAAVLGRVARGVFDNDIDPELTAEFLADPRHHLAVVIEDGVVVGMASGVHYVHPDKPPQLFINEVGVAPTHQGRGFGRQLVELLVRLATDLRCTEAWVLTDQSNMVAKRLYEGAGGATPPDPCIMYTIRIVPAVVAD